MVIFRKRLKERRKELGLTQEEVGLNVYLSKAEICAYETGKRIPPFDVLIKLSDFLSVDFLWLIGMDLKSSSGSKLIYLCDDDIKIIRALKNNEELYEKILQNPERVINQINNKLK